MSGRGKAVLAALVTISALAVSCGKDSNTVASPTNSLNAMSVAGTWAGSYASIASSCAATPMTITFQQNGSTLVGNVTTTNSCAPHGVLKATISGNSVVGNIEMIGCTGGAVNGQVSDGVLAMSVGDFYKPLVTEQQVLMQGGSVTLRH